MGYQIWSINGQLKSLQKSFWNEIWWTQIVANRMRSNLRLCLTNDFNCHCEIESNNGDTFFFFGLHWSLISYWNITKKWSNLTLLVFCTFNLPRIYKSYTMKLVLINTTNYSVLCNEIKGGEEKRKAMRYTKINAVWYDQYEKEIQK